MSKEGARIRLRELEERDAEKLFPIWSDPEVVRYLNMQAAATITEVRSMIYILRSLAGKKKAYRWAILDLNTEEILGTCGFNDWDEENARGEIGYELGRQYWGKGYMEEALILLFDHAFTVMGANRIEAKVVPENKPSIHLLEKLQFQHEGRLRKYERMNGQYEDVMLFSLLKEEFPFNF
ncbi:GNAT family N-acetyltransferase [Metabacillus sp. KIGAM252]|uniref:GNAT family N-acetyltransferase n=1 Tax=Metabacillus flavus TaxID=2823519 RepID=A0ABS5LI78_9BACI|nr:GNAT family protein [Metabacillus flavus]MBS2970465.1 GNAT family N-acetyltransferase [Metabacillus flavus]